MTILASELFAQGATSDPIDDFSLTGGTIFVGITGSNYFGITTQPAVASVLEVLSDDAGDTNDNITVVGRDSGGNVQTETVLMNGLSAVILGSTVFDYVQSFSIDGGYLGNITLRISVAGVTVATLPIFPQMQKRVTMFKNSFSDALVPIIRYEKMHWRMASSGETLVSPEVELIADPSSRIRQGITVAKNDSTSIVNRRTVPPGVTFVDDSVAQAVPSGLMTAGENIGVWYEQNLPAGDPANKSTFTSQLSGQDIP